MKEDWFRRKGEDTLIFVPATSHSDKSDLKIKVIENAGKNLKRRLQKPNPFRKKPCNNVTQCVTCSPDKGSYCRKNNNTFEFECLATNA